KQEGLPGFRIAVDRGHGPRAQQLRQIARLMDLHVIVPQIIPDIGGPTVGEVIQRSAAKTVEMIVPALQRPELGWRAHMPLANQGCAVAGLAQQGWECWLLWR